MLALYMDEPERYGLEDPQTAYILYNKTQGTAGHVWLLAMACVFCDTFPDATYLGGDKIATMARVLLYNEALYDEVVRLAQL